MSEIETTPTVENVETPENSTIKQMRQALEAANASKKEAERQAGEFAAKLKEREDADLSETERMRRELDELKPLRETSGKYLGKLESFYNEELANVPEDKKAAVEALSSKGDWADRLDAIRAAKALMPSAPAVSVAMGAAINPVSVPPKTPTAAAFDPRNPPSLNDVFRKN